MSAKALRKKAWYALREACGTRSPGAKSTPRMAAQPVFVRPTRRKTTRRWRVVTGGKEKTVGSSFWVESDT